MPGVKASGVGISVQQGEIDDDAVGLAQLGVPANKGGLIVSDGTDVKELAVGSDNQVLVADSAQDDGVKWAGAGWSKVGEEILTSAAATITVTGISSSAKIIKAYLIGCPNGASTRDVRIIINSDTTDANYDAETAGSTGGVSVDETNADNRKVWTSDQGSDNAGGGEVTIIQEASDHEKAYIATGGKNSDGVNITKGHWSNTAAAISSVGFGLSGDSFQAGTMLIVEQLL